MVIDELRQSQQELAGARSQLQHMAAINEQLNVANGKVSHLVAEQAALHTQLNVAHHREKELRWVVDSVTLHCCYGSSVKWCVHALIGTSILFSVS